MLKLLLLLLVLSATGRTHRLNKQQRYMRLVKQINWIREESERNETFSAQIQEHNRVFGFKGDLQNLPPIRFNCDIEESDGVPTSVHKLRPSDVKVIAGIGDSVTAAFGARASSIVGIFREDRGISWSTGGDGSLEERVSTLANILKKFNPRLHGFSFGECSIYGECTQLNRALTGEEAAGMPAQAKDLVQKIKDDKLIDINNDWKLVNFFIGPNDLCMYCTDEDWYSADKYIGYIRVALNTLMAELPRTIVTLNSMLDVTQLPQISDGLGCDVIQDFVCTCATDESEKNKMRAAFVKYNQKIFELVSSGRYDTKEDFTVVLQEHFLNSKPYKKPGEKRVDKTYWAPDCFHPSMKGQLAFGHSLWNSIMEPVGEKRRRVDWDSSKDLLCPTKENPYIWTNRNSPGAEAYLKQQTEAFRALASTSEVEGLEMGKDKSKRPANSTAFTVMSLGGVCIGLIVAMFITTLVLVLQQRRKLRALAQETMEARETGQENPAFEEQQQHI